MKKKESKLSVLRKQYDENWKKEEDISFPEFIQKKSNEPGFWEWLFDDYDGVLTFEQKEKFEILIKKSKFISKRSERIKEKNADLHILLASSDKRIILSKAKELKLSLSEYVRKVALGYEIKAKTDIETAMQIRKIGVNINQIAFKINKEPATKNIYIGLSELKIQWEYLQKILEKIQ